MRISDLNAGDEKTIHQIAELLKEAFAHVPGWLPTDEDALAEVRESFGPNRISRVALDENGNGIGWIGGIESYHGNVYELHPLAVKSDHQGQGIGTALVRDFEEQVRQRGAGTVYLGTDDEFGGTTLYGQNLYPNVLEHLANIRNIGRHPSEFYRKCGYSIVGLLPDANGLGKPDIFMAKRVRA